MKYLISASVFILFPILLCCQNNKKVIKIPLEKDQWEIFADDKVQFIDYRSVAAIKLLPEAGDIILKDHNFSTGTIEFDVEIGPSPFVGISFREQSDQEREWFYLRTHAADNPTFMDAIQYAPIVKGVTLWDMYEHYQGPAIIKKDAWNHVKLVIAKHQMQIFVNEEEQPTLYIPQLLGNTQDGAIALSGAATFANLTISPDDTGNLSDEKGYDFTQRDTRFLRNWQVTEPVDFPFGKDIMNEDIPNENTQWSPLKAESFALVNLSRAFGLTKSPNRRLVWLKTTIESEKSQSRLLNLGFSDEVWVLINGQLLYLDKNYYRSPIMKEPRGRCSVENTSFEVPLREGDNELMIGVGNNFFGWGIVARWDRLEGIILK